MNHKFLFFSCSTGKWGTTVENGELSPTALSAQTTTLRYRGWFGDDFNGDDFEHMAVPAVTPMYRAARKPATGHHASTSLHA